MSDSQFSVSLGIAPRQARLRQFILVLELAVQSVSIVVGKERGRGERIVRLSCNFIF